jgi:cystathionine beta-lyase
MDMASFDFDTFVDRRQTASVKWDRYKDRDVLPMWVADMDFCSPPAVIDALHRRVDHGVFGYTSAPEPLVECLVDLMEKRYGWKIEPEWLVWLPGLVTGLNVACRAVGAPGDAVMSATPVYPPFLTAPGHFQRTLIRVPMSKAKHRWEPDFDRMEAQMTPETRLLLWCSPHNPVGRVFSRFELERLAEICLAHDVIICSDEIHCDLVLDPEKWHIPTASLAPEVADQTITLMAPSKTFNIPGLSCAFAVISQPALRGRFTKAMEGIVPHVNALGYTAALAAFSHGWEWLAALIDYLRANRNRVAERIDRISGLSAAPVEASYLTWIDTRQTGIENPAGFFEKAGVGLSDGRDFDGDGFVRLNFGCRRRQLDLALDRMEAALAAL